MCINSIILVIVITIIFTDSLTPPNNVCKTFEGYYSNQGCYYNPDQNLELPDIVTRYGFPVEKYEVVTNDGYILSIFRIPRRGSTPVFLQHGVFGSAITFVLAGNNSLGFVLANANYDVWLGNFRGTRYSNRHVRLSNDDFDYWDFSLNELGVNDIASQLNLVHEVTRKRLIYIGFSLGSVAVHVYMSTYPQLANKVMKTVINLAPAVIMDPSRSIFNLVGPLSSIIQTFVNNFNHGELFRRDGPILKIIPNICLPYPHQMRMCFGLIQLAFGVDPEQINPETLPIILAQEGDSNAMKMAIHQGQIISKRRFQYFDYGALENLQIYGSAEPPAYNLSSIITPNYLIYGKGDYIVTKRSVLDLYNQYSIEAKRFGYYAVPHAKFSHTDFLMAKDAKILLYDHILHFMSRL